MVLKEKADSLETRKKIRQDADRQKQQLQEAFAKMRAKGRIDASLLEQFGLSPDAMASYTGDSGRKLRSSASQQRVPELAASRGSVGDGSNLTPAQKNRKPATAFTGSRKSGSSSGARPSRGTSSKRVRKDDALHQIELLRQKQNQELLKVLDEEQEREQERDRLLKNAANEEERKSLDKRFGYERALASEKIVGMSEAHENVIQQEMKRLGLI